MPRGGRFESGEYTALVFAGVMDFEVALRVVQQRGEAMQAASDETPSGMVSILGLEAGAGPGPLRPGAATGRDIAAGEFPLPGQCRRVGTQRGV
jgi:[acyl-carrier-protein] S-malonyltransferase